MPNVEPTEQTDTTQYATQGLSLALLVRASFGGVLMGLANLVPGISGGTMLLAAGIYPRFVDGVAEVTRLKFRFQSLVVLATVGVSAALSILLLASVLKDLVVDYRWGMYSLFIGLTLGGVPLVWRLAGSPSTNLITSAVIAFLAMVALALAQAYGVVGAQGGGQAMLFVAGLAGASAMILPGISGGYLLLLLGQYVPILSGIGAFKDALKAGDITAAMGPAFSVMLPVGLGVVIGVAVVGNLLQWLLHHHRRGTLGALLGLLLGSTVGLWPFQVGVAPQLGEVIKGQIVTAENIGDIDEEDWKVEFFTPSLAQVAGSLLFLVAGFGATLGIAKIGGEETDIQAGEVVPSDSAEPAS